LIAAATGVSGWTFGVPSGPARLKEHGQYTLRFSGRTSGARAVHVALQRQDQSHSRTWKRMPTTCSAGTARTNDPLDGQGAAPKNLVSPTAKVVNSAGGNPASAVARFNA
jgi:hypothetical protein